MEFFFKKCTNLKETPQSPFSPSMLSSLSVSNCLFDLLPLLEHVWIIDWRVWFIVCARGLERDGGRSVLTFCSSSSHVHCWRTNYKSDHWDQRALSPYKHLLWAVLWKGSHGNLPKLCSRNQAIMRDVLLICKIRRRGLQLSDDAE